VDHKVSADISVDQAKAMAKRLRAALSERGVELPHGQVLDLVARTLEAGDWNTLLPLLATPKPGEIEFADAIPVLRIFSVEKATEFYVDYLGLTLDWTHQFEPGMPTYLQVSRSGMRLHLSEHHGDGSPNGVAWIAVDDVEALLAELQSKNYPSMRPGIESDGPGGATIEVIDPFGNVLRLVQSQD
jgi:catechol 2,3-dioxygenase-like lactoylglutathione lyase family enzyme